MIHFDTPLLSGLKFIDLFAGIGGFRLALESLGAKCLFSSEINQDARLVYYNNFGEYPSGDITCIDEHDIPPHDILCAGFPCQAFSASGNKLGFADSRGTLFFDVARIAKFHKPKAVFMENVMHFTTHDNGNTLSVVKNTLEELGYDFYYHILDAAQYGIPQQRKRTYMVALRKDIEKKDFHFPSQRSLNLKVKDLLLDNSDELSDLFVKNKEIYRPKRMLKEDSILLGFWGKAGQGQRVYSPDGVSVTLTTGNKIVFAINNDINTIRRLHPREAARLMGFPDTHIINTNHTTAHYLIGNSVVIDVIQYIAAQIAYSINNQEEEFTLLP